MGFFQNLFGGFNRSTAEPEKPVLEGAAAKAEQKKENTAIYSSALRSTLEGLLEAGEVDRAIKMFACHRDEAMKALSEYRPDEHKINFRQNKKRKDQEDYESYFEDTMRAGHYMNKPEAVETMIKESPELIEDLISMGVSISTKPCSSK